jgi:hypothetical protein
MPGGGPAGRLDCKGRDQAFVGAFALAVASSALKYFEKGKQSNEKDILQPTNTVADE